MITVDEIMEWIGRIELAKGDYERQHIIEDNLWNRVLVAIADGAENPAELARTALESRKIRFQRVCS